MMKTASATTATAILMNMDISHEIWTYSQVATTRLIPVSWWRHEMETLSALLAICAGNSPASSEFPTQRPVTRSFDVFFDMCLNN